MATDKHVKMILVKSDNIIISLHIFFFSLTLIENYLKMFIYEYPYKKK
jgi:hypothetical protein